MQATKTIITYITGISLSAISIEAATFFIIGLTTGIILTILIKKTYAEKRKEV